MHDQTPQYPVPTHAAAPVSRPSVRLIALNAGLLGVLLAVTLSSAQPAANPPAAPQAAARGRGEYALVAGRAQGMTTHVVYILDAANRDLAAITWDRSRQQFEPLGYRNLADDARYFRPAR